MNKCLPSTKLDELLSICDFLYINRPVWLYLSVLSSVSLITGSHIGLDVDFIFVRFVYLLGYISKGIKREMTCECVLLSYILLKKRPLGHIAHFIGKWSV